MDLKGKHIAVVGLGVSGEACVRFLLKRGARVVAADNGSSQMLKETARATCVRRRQGRTGRSRPRHVRKYRHASFEPPACRTRWPLSKRCEKRGVPVLGEIEFASRFVSEPVVAVTGTNGKTTVTTLLGDMLQRSGFKTFVGGNIGNPLIEHVDSEEKADRIVLELSSFQLDTIHTFRAQTAVLLNVTDDPHGSISRFRGLYRVQSPNFRKPDFGRLRGAERFGPGGGRDRKKA